MVFSELGRVPLDRRIRRWRSYRLLRFGHIEPCGGTCRCTTSTSCAIRLIGRNINAMRLAPNDQIHEERQKHNASRNACRKDIERYIERSQSEVRVILTQKVVPEGVRIVERAGAVLAAHRLPEQAGRVHNGAIYDGTRNITTQSDC